MLNFLKQLTRKFNSDACRNKSGLTVDPGITITPNPDLKVVNNGAIDWGLWVSASSTRNYLMNDPLLDWLEYYLKPGADITCMNIKEKQYKVTKRKPGKKEDPKGTMLEYILQQGVDFESDVMKYLYSILPHGSILDIKGTDDSRSIDKFNETRKAIVDGVPVIYSGVLWDHATQTYGVPDLIIRSDWISRILNDTTSFPYEDDDDIYESSNLTKNYHYRIIDIKFSTVKYRSKGWCMVNAGSAPAYKGQIYIYHRALSNLQGYDPEYAYVLGKGWSRTSNRVKSKGDNCMDELGVIDYSDWDESYISRTNEAVEWIRDIRRYGHSWNFDTLPLPRKELYPNMSNLNDSPWRNVKLQISDKIKEITGLWMCGMKNRSLAHSREVYGWDQEGCTMDVLGIKNEKIRMTITKMVDVNMSPDINILPTIIRNNPMGWKRKKSLELYVDFETCVVNDSTEFPRVTTYTILSLIGVGHYDKNGEWVYQSFRVDDLTKRHAKIIVNAFNAYVDKLKLQYKVKKPLLVHYSKAEPCIWSNNSDRSYQWFDLLSLLKDEPVVVKGALSYSLKDIAKSMYNLGFINTIWDEYVLNGGDAMILLKDTYKSNPEEVKTTLNNVINYNEVDCKVLGEIITYLRNNHTR